MQRLSLEQAASALLVVQGPAQGRVQRLLLVLNPAAVSHPQQAQGQQEEAAA